MPAYKPGQGLNSAALERLRSRKLAGDEGIALPAKDDSKQWDRLLGEGAKKKPRCGVCTRPLEDEVQVMGGLVCLQCAASSNCTAAPKQQRSKIRVAEDACPTPPTPSTQVTDVEHEREAPASPLTPDIAAPPPPTPEQIAAAVARKVLDGDWVDDRGAIYKIEFSSETNWKCLCESSARSLTYALHYDASSHTLWWGSDGAYFVQLAEISEQTKQIVWQPWDSTHKFKHRYSWYRSEKVSSSAESKVEECAQESAVSAGRQGPLGRTRLEEQNNRSILEQEVIQAVEMQLSVPGSNGFVWIDRWNEKYMRQLGTLRTFLESQPAKFTVVAGRGKGYRVRLASSESNQQQGSQA